MSQKCLIRPNIQVWFQYLAEYCSMRNFRLLGKTALKKYFHYSLHSYSQKLFCLIGSEGLGPVVPPFVFELEAASWVSVLQTKSYHQLSPKDWRRGREPTWNYRFRELAIRLLPWSPWSRLLYLPLSRVWTRRKKGKWFIGSLIPQSKS